MSGSADDYGQQRSGRRQNLMHEAARYIRDQILAGELKPGQKIDQEAVASALQFSRLPVRESLIVLESDGLVENIPRRGAYVSRLAPSDIHDHYEAYGAISGLAASRAASLMDDATFDRLQDLNDRMRESTDPRVQDQLNYEFHREINRAGQSRRLIAVLRTLSASMPTHFYEFNTEFRVRAEQEHQEILEALRARDGKAAAEEVASHFRNVGNQAVNTLRVTGYWDDAEDEEGAGASGQSSRTRA